MQQMTKVHYDLVLQSVITENVLLKWRVLNVVYSELCAVLLMKLFIVLAVWQSQ